jgi:UDP-N-acetylglucosamine 4,6-dehydratase
MVALHSFAETRIDLNGASVLITGGTGSFGQAFVGRVLQDYRPARLVVFSRDEQKQYEMAQRFSPADYPCMRYFIGDVRDVARLETAMRGIDYVVHAAALKHVPAAEYNPFECIRTNVQGAENVATAAIHNGIRKVIALSTDKAASPINLYGASKLAADKIFIAANHMSGVSGPRFAIVRYGNVLGSRGSILPYFQKLLAEGSCDLPITDPRMTRFWITLGQGVNFVLSSMAMMRGGEIFVPKIPSMGVAEMAKALAPELPHRIVGIRPSEKLHEIMIPPDDARHTVELTDRYSIEPSLVGWEERVGLPDAQPVDEDFCYASNLNSLWLDRGGLLTMIEQAAHEQF